MRSDLYILAHNDHDTECSWKQILHIFLFANTFSQVAAGRGLHLLKIFYHIFVLIIIELIEGIKSKLNNISIAVICQRAYVLKSIVGKKIVTVEEGDPLS